MIIPLIEDAIRNLWDVEDPYGGGIARVLEGVALVQFKDGSFGVLNLDDGDGEPYFGDNNKSYISTLERAEDVLRSWRECYQESPKVLDQLLGERA